MLPVTRENVKRIADQVLAAGGTKIDIDFALWQEFGVMMGNGGPGPWEGWPHCRYCCAYGGGGHAGLCPGGTEPEREEPAWPAESAGSGGATEPTPALTQPTVAETSLFTQARTTAARWSGRMTAATRRAVRSVTRRP